MLRRLRNMRPLPSSVESMKVKAKPSPLRESQKRQVRKYVGTVAFLLLCAYLGDRSWDFYQDHKSKRPKKEQTTVVSPSLLNAQVPKSAPAVVEVDCMALLNKYHLSTAILDRVEDSVRKVGGIAQWDVADSLRKNHHTLATVIFDNCEKFFLDSLAYNDVYKDFAEEYLKAAREGYHVR